MAKKKTTRYSKQFKAKVALETLKGVETVNQIAKRYSVHPTQINQWKKHALESLPDAFERGKKPGKDEQEELVNDLFRQIGQLKYELDWVKKKSDQFNQY